MFSASLVAAFVALAVFDSASASVLSARQTSPGCGPNFQGHPISITYGGSNGVDELGVASNTAGAGLTTQPESAFTAEFLVENSGHFPSSYLIKDQNDHSLVVYAGIRGHAPPLLNLNSIDNSGVDVRQYWFITCDTCASPSANVPPGGVFGISCQIETTVFSFCIQSPDVLGNPPVLAACADKPNQKFNLLRGSI
ncbi:hypothetical protein MVEN_01117400 [Mycena venus]|uniref:Uncharacterized protein n=1 Tax=Mycena venus TaxID=2733690 RepID=A0A8H6Y9F1_9AGAR|nr:hypothetical protein MVEN_01117400 [Mycena venus]